MVAARSVRAATGQTVCVTVTHIDGLVLALERQSPAEPQGIPRVQLHVARHDKAPTRVR
jgi:hypothetical protein